GPRNPPASAFPVARSDATIATIASAATTPASSASFLTARGLRCFRPRETMGLRRYNRRLYVGAWWRSKRRRGRRNPRYAARRRGGRAGGRHRFGSGRVRVADEARTAAVAAPGGSVRAFVDAGSRASR